MATYLERYQNGEHERVWQELTALEAKVRQSDILPDALAVARETMRRARLNIDMIYQRLKTLGYTFQSPNEAFTPPAQDVAARLDEFEREVGLIPISLRAWCELVGEVNFMGSYAGLSSYEQRPTSLMMGGVGKLDLGAVLREFTQSDKLKSNIPPDMQGPLQNLLNSLQKLKPDAPTAAQRTPKQEAPFIASDPLVMEVMAEMTPDAYEAWMSDEYTQDEPFRLPVAPDDLHKSNTSGGDPYEFILPNAHADLQLLNERHNTFFVPYLRIVFQWGGFPGLEGDENASREIITMLTAGLLPI